MERPGRDEELEYGLKGRCLSDSPSSSLPQHWGSFHLPEGPLRSLADVALSLDLPSERRGPQGPSPQGLAHLVPDGGRLPGTATDLTPFATRPVDSLAVQLVLIGSRECVHVWGGPAAWMSFLEPGGFLGRALAQSRGVLVGLSGHGLCCMLFSRELVLSLFTSYPGHQLLQGQAGLPCSCRILSSWHRATTQHFRLQE